MKDLFQFDLGQFDEGQIKYDDIIKSNHMTIWSIKTGWSNRIKSDMTIWSIKTGWADQNKSG